MIIKELVKIQELNFVKSNCNSLLFDGVNEDLLVTPSSNFNFEWTDSWSIDGWIFPRSSTVGIHIALAKWDISLPRGWFFTILGFTSSLSGALRLQLRQAASGHLDAYSNTGVVFDQWNHVAVTYDGSGTNAGITFYVNGVATSKPNLTQTPSSSGPITSGTIINSEPVTINSIPDNGNWAVDYLQSMRVWDVVLTPSEILELTNKTSVPQGTNLILDLDVSRSTFNGSEWEVPDQTGNNTVVSRNMESDDLTSQCPLDFALKSLSFDGVNEYLNCSNNTAFDFDYGDSFSIETWVKFDDLSSFGFLVSKWLAVPPADALAYFLGTNGNKLTFRFFDNGGGTSGIIVDSLISLNVGEWYHLVATYDGSSNANGINLYINNTVSNNIIRNNATGSVLNTEPLQIGGQDTFFTNGQIAKVRVWNVELTPVEVTKQWNDGKIIKEPVQKTNLVLDTNIQLSKFISSDFIIPDSAGVIDSTTSVNMEAQDLLPDAP